MPAMTSDTVIDADCKHPPGLFGPVIDRNRCEGKADCLAVCPHDVFILRKVPTDERRGLSFIGKIKGYAHDWNQAFALNAQACQACGQCVSACPERAITLARR
jgi:NAD-dependent dihydropyrimidine dehydrogenase PreA subunit